MREKFKYAGQEMRISNNALDLPTGQVLAGKTIEVEDYWQNVSGQSWMSSNGNPTAMLYGMRSGMQGLPINNDVVYGKVHGLGVMVHVTELEVIE